MGNTSSASASSAISDKLLGSLLRATACEIDEKIHLIDHDLDLPESFNEAHIKALWEHFQVLGDKDTKSGELFITRGGFQEALGYKDQPNLFLERVFQVFDTDGDTKINFAEFVSGLDLLSPESPAKSRTEFLFKVFDLNKDGLISPGELRGMLSAAMTEHDLPVSMVEIQKMVDATFTEYDVNKDGYINLDEFSALAASNPAFLKPVTLQAQAIIDQKLKEAGTGAKGAAAGGGK